MPIVRNPVSSGIATALIQDRKPVNTDGGTFTAGAWRIRDLNSIFSSIAGLSLSNDRFTVPAGNYILQSTAPAVSVNRHQSRLFDVSANAVAIDANNQEIYSDRAVATGSASTATISTIFAQLQLASAKTFRIEHYCQTTVSGFGFGLGNTFTASPAIFTQVLIVRL